MPDPHDMLLRGSLGTHVLLAACGDREEAFEDFGRGLFTEALLRALDGVQYKHLTYVDAFSKMTRLAKCVTTRFQCFKTDLYCD